MESEWTETGWDEAEELSREPGCRVLHVGDGVIGHARVLDHAEGVDDGLQDYAEGYHAGSTGPVEVKWALFVEGERVAHGTHSFMA